MARTITETVPESNWTLQIFISYDDFLNAAQISELLNAVDEIYETVRYAPAPHLRALPELPSGRLRIHSIATGNSIFIQLINGVTQIAGSMDPLLAGIVAGVPALAATGRVLLRGIEKAEKIRALMRKNRIDEERGRLELTDKRLDIHEKAFNLDRSIEDRIRHDTQLQARELDSILRSLGFPEVNHVEDLAIQLQEPLDRFEAVTNAPNIIRVEVSLHPLTDELSSGH